MNEILGAFLGLWKHKLFTIAGVKLSLGNLLMALTFLLFSTRIAKLIAKQINKRIILKFVEEKSAQNTYQTFAFYGSLAGVIAMSLTVAGIPLTIFTVVGGALAIGVGFGSQNIVNNFISGIIMLVEQPIKVGDVVEVDGVTGAVLSIGTRSTKIKNGDNKIFIVPNSFFLEKSVMNWTFEDTVIRGIVQFGVAYGTDTKKLEHACLDIMLNNPNILQNPMPSVLFQDFADNNLVFQAIFFCDVTRVASVGAVQSEVRFALDQKCRELKFEMAFPQRDLAIKAPIQVKVLS